MARETYEAWALRRLPRWLRGDALDKFSSIIFGNFDLVYQAARDAISATFITAAPVDSLDYHGKSRLLERLDGETDEQYRTRIVGAWDFWSGLGITTGLRDALRTYTGCAALEVYAVNTQTDDWLGAVPNINADEDQNTDNWSRHAIVIPQTHPWVREAVGPDLVVGPDLMVGLSMTESELKRIRRIYRKHRPAHMCGIEIYVVIGVTPAAYVLADHYGYDVVRLALGPAPMVGYLSHGMVIGDAMRVGVPIT